MYHTHFFSGDRDNHIASLHLAQMLYIWPYFVFFSFPVLLPWLLNLCVPPRYLPRRVLEHASKDRLPSLATSVATMSVMLAIVHYNTIVHPFTLADNRHYTFYVFRILLRHQAIKYAAVPIYFACAWTTITAFGGPHAQPFAPTKVQTVVRGRGQVPPTQARKIRGNTVPFVLVWLLATTLSIVTAPLVEPRYLIIPWMIWRLHIMSPYPRPKWKPWQKEPPGLVPYDPVPHAVLAEMFWFLVINFGTGYMFLFKGFAWVQEPGKVQRFMW